MNMKCPKCSGEFEKGFVKGNSGYDQKQAWGTSVTWRGIVKIGESNGKTILTYRCKNCGYLESYAKE